MKPKKEVEKKILELIEHLSLSLVDFIDKNFNSEAQNDLDQTHIIQNGIMNFANNAMYQIISCLDDESKSLFLFHCLEIFTYRFQKTKPKTEH